MDLAEFEQLVAQIGEEILARVAPGNKAPEREKLHDCVACGADRVSTCEPLAGVDPTLAAYIDHTILRADATAADVRKICAEARRYCFASVCVNPSWVPLVAAELAGSGVKVCTVVGFPLGAASTSAKVAEAEVAIKVGAHEVDMVINVGALKGGDHEYVKNDIQAVATVCHRGGAILKVITRNRTARRRAKGGRLLALQAGGRRLRKNIHRIRPRRRDRARHRADASHRRTRRWA